MLCRRLLARPCASALRTRTQHPVHLLTQRVACPSESSAEPTQTVEPTPVFSLHTFEAETDQLHVAACRRTLTLPVDRRRRHFGCVVRHGQKVCRGVCVRGVGRWRLERVCVHEGCEWDRCDGEECATVVACLGLVGHWETRPRKGEEHVAECGCDDTRR